MMTLKENLEKKKFLNNELQELKGNIRVYCRIRPFLSNFSTIRKYLIYYMIIYKILIQLLKETLIYLY